MTPETYRCGVAARGLPRALAAAVLIAALLAGFRLEASSFANPLRGAVVVVGAFLALWIVRAGSEVRIRLHFEGSRLLFSTGRQSAPLELDSIERLDHEAPFGVSRRLFPAAVLIERNGRRWRLPMVIDRGSNLLDELLRRAGRSDLDTWSETLRLKAWMGRGARVVWVGYGLAVVIVTAGWLFYVR